MNRETKRKKYRIEQFHAIRVINNFSLSPDSKTIAYITNTNGLPNIWTIPLSGGWASQITLEENAVKELYYSPVRNEIIFLCDKMGNEAKQLFLISDKGGEVKYLTEQFKDSEVHFTMWNKKGDKILFCTNKRDSRFFDTYIYDFKKDSVELVFQSESLFAEFPSYWSSDEKLIAFNRHYNNSSFALMLFDRNKNTMTEILKDDEPVKNIAPYIDKKNKYIYLLSDKDSEYMGIMRYEIKTGKISWFAKENWDIEGFDFSNKEKLFLYTVNESGSTVLKLMNLITGKTKKLNTPLGNISHAVFTKDEKKIVLLSDTPNNPSDIYVYDIAKANLKQITFSMIGGIPSADFTVPKQIKYKSFDGLKIYANLYIPRWMKKNGSNPAVVLPHGGPEWQDRLNFNKFAQILNNSGFIVITPNFRGSTGYGKSFQIKIYKDWGGAEFKDVLGAYDYLVSSGYADKNKIAVIGGSFGGFMTLTCVTKAPDLWKCAVDIFGPSNLFTFLNSVPEYWKPGAYALVGHPENDKELLSERSPIYFVDNIKCPMLIIQGKNDPRVVVAESDQIVDKLRARNKQVDYLVLEDEGHGFSKVSNQIKVWKLITGFLERHLN
jgi:dipeptidyl aminopeptidase/acylaminoacyl peptidase